MGAGSIPLLWGRGPDGPGRVSCERGAPSNEALTAVFASALDLSITPALLVSHQSWPLPSLVPSWPPLVQTGQTDYHMPSTCPAGFPATGH